MSIVEFLVLVVFGWPAIFLSLTISVIGIMERSAFLLLVGALVVVPFSWYLAMTPAFQIAGLFLPLCQIGAVVALRRQIRWLACLLLLPFGMIVLWLAVAVFLQSPQGDFTSYHRVNPRRGTMQ